MVRVVHAADLHIDASYAFLTGERLERRREDFLDSLSSILNVCREERADVLVISGDFFDKVNPTNNARYFAHRALRDFTRDVDCRVFIVSGNHDEPKTVHSRSPLDPLGLIKNVRVVSSGKWKHFRLSGGGFDVGLYLRGYDGLKPAVSPFLEPPSPNDDVNVAVVHGSLDRAKSVYDEWSSAFREYAPFSSISCSELGFDYYALGHFHTHQIVSENWGVFCYPGSPQRYSFREAEGEKGVVVLDLEPGFSESNVQFVPLPCRELVVKDVVLDTSMSNLEEVILNEVPVDGGDRLLDVRLMGKVMFDEYKRLRISHLASYLNQYWFAVKIDKLFSVYDPVSEYEFEDLKSINVVEEFKKRMSEKLRVAEEEGNVELKKKYKWMLENGVKLLVEIGGQQDDFEVHSRV